MSPETPDGELLRLYVRRRSEAAFGLLVRRHLNDPHAGPHQDATASVVDKAARTASGAAATLWVEWKLSLG